MFVDCSLLEKGRVGETYNIGGDSERRNIDVVRAVCKVLDELSPEKPAGVSQFAELFTHVRDRPGHDQRYAINASKLCSELHWRPLETFESGLKKTVQWYLNNREYGQVVQHQMIQSPRCEIRSI